MREEEIVARYAIYGRVTQTGEIFLPFFTSKQFVDECTNVRVAIIGIEFFHVGPEYVIPISPLNGIDNSIFLKKTTHWEDVVKLCNKSTINILQEEEIRDHTQWYNPTLFEESEWRRTDAIPNVG